MLGGVPKGAERAHDIILDVNTSVPEPPPPRARLGPLTVSPLRCFQLNPVGAPIEPRMRLGGVPMLAVRCSGARYDRIRIAQRSYIAPDILL